MLSVACQPQAYQDYNDLMRVTEEMVSGMVKAITGSYKVHYHMDGPDKDPVEVNFEAPWRRIPMISGLEQHLKTKFPSDLDSEETRLFLIQLVSLLVCSPTSMNSSESACVLAIVPLQKLLLTS